MSLIKWDGKDETGKYTYDMEDVERWDMVKETETGCILYTTKEKEPRQMVWCIKRDLTSHLHRLEQIKSR